MATYVNNLRLKEITTGDEDGTWGTSTNTNLELITDGFSYGTKQMSSDANQTFTMPDATADATRGFYLKITSAGSLTSTREVTLGPNTVSKVWMIENATTGGQSITIKQGSGAGITIPTTQKVMVITDGAGSGAAVINANPTETGGTVTSVGGTGTVNGISLSGTVTTSGNLTLGGTLSGVNLTSQVTGVLPTANGGTGSNQATFVNLASNVTGTLPLANGGTNGTTAATARASLSANALPILKGGNYTAAAGEFVTVTAGSITITLPASPSAGSTVTIKDGTGAAATTTFTVARNGSNIASSATDLIFDKNFAEITMSYINSTIGWSV
tara:strand:+ start:704 stop:1690 length:987 start_codon:yes stop_codon:yes gene_type:complete